MDETIKLIGAIAPIIAALLSFVGLMYTRKVEKQTNSMKDELVKVTGIASHAIGRAEGIKEEKDRIKEE